ncbi:hypothetical protein [Roseinatronobacter alkalisoli]|uniref:DUF4169 family protein n=1 Tax=Roseinatronobacter alkalisoli TaxID=3028235 RepID=A0ABT5T971_9RHOB|nr:hypothetical protein [Roseinatronobacter sp. HJB301]MDD7971665.1 hypothetical protein [Roseinatronobacter sp. HJB301]
MSDKKPDPTRRTKTPPDARAARLKAALKANIARRKAQARARDAQGGQQDHAAQDTEHHNE